MRDVLPTLEQWSRTGTRAALATVVSVERSAPREPGSIMALSEHGQIAGSVTGGCVEPDIVLAAEEVIGGGPPRLREYGIADEEAFAVGLPCGGAVRIFVEAMDPRVVESLAHAVRGEMTLGVITRIAGPHAGERVVTDAAGADPEAAALIRRGSSGAIGSGDDERFVLTVAPRPRMYVFGAIDFASSLASLGRFLGYHVTVCDARSAFVTPERFPDADELVVEWPHELIASAQIDERSAICVLTHDAKFDVPALLAVLKTPAGYIGAMGSRRTTSRREERLREEGLTDRDLARIHAPIGLSIGSRTPQEVAVAICAQVIQAMRASIDQTVSVSR
jgi:xanthine dehydrogenase accessory factor